MPLAKQVSQVLVDSLIDFAFSSLLRDMFRSVVCDGRRYLSERTIVTSWERCVMCQALYHKVSRVGEAECSIGDSESRTETQEHKKSQMKMTSGSPDPLYEQALRVPGPTIAGTIRQSLQADPNSISTM